jgi:putative membrane protein
MESIGDHLAFLNACLNGTSALFILCGGLAIRAQKRETHKKFMLAAFATSAIFLCSYLTRVALTGTHKDPHTGILHMIYLAVLGSHMLLAVVTVPLVLAAIRLALKKKFATHRKVVRWAYPVWLYVSVTGVAVYVMLYRL